MYVFHTISALQISSFFCSGTFFQLLVRISNKFSRNPAEFFTAWARWLEGVIITNQYPFPARDLPNL